MMLDIAHIHPMLVHFPIVLYLLAAGLQLLVLLRHGDLAAGTCLANCALGALLLGAASAVVAAIFGDIALDQAMAAGFPAKPLATHQAFGISTTTLMLVLSSIYLIARWRHWRLAERNGWLLWVLALAGVALLIVTAYYGGNLVYVIGVNVKAVT